MNLSILSLIFQEAASISQFQHTLTFTMTSSESQLNHLMELATPAQSEIDSINFLPAIFFRDKI